MRSQVAQPLLQADPTSKLVLESWPTNLNQPDDDADQGTMWDQAVEGENVLEVSREEIPSLELADQIAVCKRIPCHGTKFDVSQHQFNVHGNIHAAITA